MGQDGDPRKMVRMAGKYTGYIGSQSGVLEVTSV